MILTYIYTIFITQLLWIAKTLRTHEILKFPGGGNQSKNLQG